MDVSGVQTILGVRAQKVTKGLGILFFVAVLGVGCGKKQGTFDGIMCGDHTDQVKSFMNPMDSTVVQAVTIDSSIPSSQVAQIQAAINTWNTYGRNTVGHDLFKAQQAGLSTDSVPQSSGGCDFPGTSGAFSIAVVSDKNLWTSLGFSVNTNPGVTLRCTSTAAEYASKQVVLLNPNASGYDTLFQNVILHELGHAIGLDHSCVMNSSGAADYIGCNGLSSGNDYVKAVMYPIVDQNNVKTNLRTNDQERAACALNWRPDA